MTGTQRVCVVDCGARCCRHLGDAVHVTTQEMRRLKQLAPGRARFLHTGRHGVWRMVSGLNGHCVFLTDNNLCSIYEARPGACQQFPHRPFRDCPISGGTTSDPSLIPST